MIQQIFSLLTVPPGNLAYHLVLAFSLVSLLQACLLDSTRQSDPSHKRMLLGTGLLLGMQLVLFLVSAFTWQGGADAHLLLPPLDRTVSLLSLIWIAWLWLFPLRHAWGDALAVLASALALAGMAYSYSLWINLGASLAFNFTWIDFGWSLAAGLVALAALVYSFIKRYPGWGFALGILGLWLAGTAAQWAFPQLTGDYSGVFRLAQLAAYPLLLALPYRISRSPERSPSEEFLHYGADPVTLQSFLEMASQGHHTLAAALQAVAQAARADYAAILTADGNPDEFMLLEGYNRIQGKPATSQKFASAQVPTLSTALLGGKCLLLGREAVQVPELASFAKSAGLTQPKSLLFAPLHARPEGSAALMLLSTHTDRTWTPADQDYLAPTLPLFDQLLPQPPEPTPPAEEVQRTRAEALSAWSSGDIEPIPAELLASLPASVPVPLEDQELNGQPYNVMSLLSLQSELQQTIARLELENQRLKQAANLGSAGPADQYLEKELQYSLTEVARLQNSLAEANVAILKLQQSSTSNEAAPARQTEVIASLVQEMRQPMASLAGYANLLMEETLGTLSVMQRKFIERIRASTTRLQCLVDDMVQVAILDTNSQPPEALETDLGYVLAQAVAFTSSQVREKNIHLSVDVPDDLPHFETDRDALEQVFIHLLQNATLATPADGSISLNARLDHQAGQDLSLLVQVTDTGGGIHKEDIDRVFSRFSRAVHIPIPGVGDTGVGLSIARTLVEALGGQIWIETEPGKSSTFCVRLPIHTPIVQNPTPEGQV